MAMVVKNNMSAVSTLNTLNKNSSALQKSLSKVSSGMKINSAQDDASGYAISERMRVQIRSLDQANQNTQNGSSMMKTAEGAVSSTVEILKSLKEKAINAANDTNKDADRTTIQKEIDQFIDQIDDNALTTFNGKYLVDGSKAQQGQATYTSMTNQSLATDTDGTTKLTALKNRNNESLEIASTDFVTASFVKDGNTYTTKFKVGEDTDLDKIFSNLNALPDENGKTIMPFGPAQTTTELMSLKNARSIITEIKAIAGADGTGSKGLFEVAAGTFSGNNDSEGHKITADSFREAVNVLTRQDEHGNAESTTSDILAALGSKTGAELNEARTNLEKAIDGSFQVGSGGKVGVKNSNQTDDGSVTGVVTVSVAATKLYDAEGNTLADEQVYTLSSKSSETALTANTAGTLDFDSDNTVGLAESRQAYREAVMASVDNIAALNKQGDLTVEIGTAIEDGTNIKADTNTSHASFTVTKTTGIKADDVVANTAGNVAQTLTAAKVTKTSDQAKDFAVATAFNAALGGQLANGKTNAIGLLSSGDLLKTDNKEVGVTVTARNAGVAGQISGVTISITDSEGNVKKAANASLDNFTTSNFAKNSSAANELSFQVGANANQAIAVGLEDMRSEALGLKGSDGSKVSVATQDKANAAIAVFDNAIAKALDQQTTIGSIEARLAYTSENLTVSSENTQAAESTIRDADMAKEMTNYTKNNVLLQAAQSMLAQANQSSSAVLSLLQ